MSANLRGKDFLFEGVFVDDETKWERVLTRKAIPRGQITLLKVLYEADGLVPESEIVERIRWGDAESFRGVVGAFSKRINATLGFRDECPGLEGVIERVVKNGERHWKLRGPMRDAVDSVPELVEELSRPLEVLMEKGGFEVAGPDPKLGDSSRPGPFDLRFGTWNLDVFRDSKAATEAKLDLVEEQVGADQSIVALQEVSRSVYRHLLRSGQFDWAYFSLLHRPPGASEAKNRQMGCVLAGDLPVEPLEVGVLERLPLPERSLAGVFRVNGTEFVAASFHSLTGVGFGAAKAAAFRTIADWLVAEQRPTLFGIDANTPKVDHPEHESTEYWKQGASILFGPEAPHEMRDALRTYLSEHPEGLEDIRECRPEGPLATTYVRGSDTASRYDRIYHSPGFTAEAITHLYDEAQEAKSDHALVVADLVFRPPEN